MQEIYDEYAKSAVFSHESEANFFALGKRYLQSYYGKYLPQKKTSPILEIGCGQGRFLKVLQEEGYTSLYGIDVSEDQIAYGKEKLGLHACLEKVDACEFLEKAEPNSYEAILLIDVLEHLPLADSITLLKLIKRALFPGGKLLIQVPNGLSPLTPQLYGDITHHRSYTQKSLKQSLILAGYSHMFFQSQPPLVHGFKSFIRRAVWELIFNPCIMAYMLIACGTSMGRIYTPNLFAVAQKEGAS